MSRTKIIKWRRSATENNRTIKKEVIFKFIAIVKKWNLYSNLPGLILFYYAPVLCLLNSRKRRRRRRKNRFGLNIVQWQHCAKGGRGHKVVARLRSVFMLWQHWAFLVEGSFNAKIMEAKIGWLISIYWLLWASLCSSRINLGEGGRALSFLLSHQPCPARIILSFPTLYISRFVFFFHLSSFPYL